MYSFFNFLSIIFSLKLKTFCCNRIQNLKKHINVKLKSVHINMRFHSILWKVFDYHLNT